MNFLNKIGQGYQSLWKLIIRPERNFYSITDLGPTIFYLGNKKVKRVDVELINPRELTFSASHFIPMDVQKYPCLIYMHGNSSNRLQGTEYLQELINEGISLLTFDFSGCGNAQGDYISLGWYEWEDLAQVVAYLSKKPQITTLGLWGRSMGAVTALMYLKQDKIIKAAVFDSPFMSLKTLIQDLCRKNSTIPMFVFSAAMIIISKTIKNKAAFDLYKLNPIEQAPKVSTPGFFIGAVDDQLVNTTHIRELFKAYGGKKHLQIVQGDHNSNRPQRCIDQAVKFLKSYLIGKQSKQKLSQEANKQEQGLLSEEDSVETQKHEIGNDKQIPSPEEKVSLNKLSFQNIINGLNPFTFVNSPAPAASLKSNTNLSQNPSNLQELNKQSQKSSPQKSEQSLNKKQQTQKQQQQDPKK